MANELSFLGGNEPSELEVAPVVETETPAPEQQAETPPEAPQSAPERPRGPDGKFLTASPPETPPEAPASPPLTEKETVGFYKAMQEERDRRQAAEKKASDLERRLAAQNQPTEPPSFEAEMKQALYAQSLKNSRRFAETQYGAATVAKVHDWAAARCDADPIFNQQMRQSDHPYEEAMQAYNRDQIIAEVSPADLDAFRAWKAGQSGNPAQPTPTPPAQPSPPPPRSLATASGTGAVGKGHVPIGEGEAFASLPFN